MKERNEVFSGGLARAGRAKLLLEIANEVKAHLGADDAPDTVTGIMVVVTHKDRGGKPAPGVVMGTIWGAGGWLQLVEASGTYLRRLGKTFASAAGGRQGGLDG